MSTFSEGMRIWKRARRVKRHGFRAYSGTTEEMCRQIITDAYDKDRGYFMVSSGHFCEFYTRDFAFCCEALAALGFTEEIKTTLEYVLLTFHRANKVTTSISPDGKPFDFPTYAPDSLALLLYAITHTGNAELIKGYEEFLQSQVTDFVERFIDPTTMLPRSGRFSSIRDHAGRESSCYDAVMIAIVAREAQELGLRFPYTEDQIRSALVGTYWNGTYFFEDQKKIGIVVGDANVFPFWSGIIEDKQMLESALHSIQATQLDNPFPLRYVSKTDKHKEKVKFHIANLFASDYEKDSIWIHLGLCYLRILARQDRALTLKHLDMYTSNLKTHGTFLEVFDNRGLPFKRLFYVTDEAMVWCANYLLLIKALQSPNIGVPGPKSQTPI